MEKYLLSCESPVDLSYDYVTKRGISIINYYYLIDGESHIDDMGKDPNSLNKFYQFLKEGKLPSTSQVNEFQYEEYFRNLLKQGHNVLHIAFGSGMTQSVNQAYLAAEIVRKEFPNQNLIVIDSVCSSSGYGLLVDDAYDLMQEGKDIKEIVSWIEENKTKIQHQFYSTDLKYLKRGGRVSGPAATVGSILHLCPLMRLNYAGRIIAYSKVIGKKKAIKSIVDEMEAHAENGLNYNGKVFISNSNCLADAEMCKQEILKRFPNVKEIKIFDIGTVIASHTGPGTVALFFHGDERIK